MSKFGKNIKKIRVVKKLSQSGFAEIFGLTRASVGAYEEGRAEPKTDTIIAIAKYFSITLDQLLIKDLTVNDIYQIDIFQDGSNPNKEEQIQVAARSTTPMVFAEVFHDYLKHRGEDIFMAQLPRMMLPGIQQETTRAFEMPDCTMEYNDKGIRQGDLVLCSKINLNETERLLSDMVYVVVSQHDIWIRRLMRIGGILELLPDHFFKPAVEIHFADVKEIWKVEGVYTQQLQRPIQLEHELNQLEYRLHKLEEQVVQSEKKNPQSK